jgi:chromosome partitioning protein
MSIISVFNQKGGCGKTMLSVHLAVAAQQAGRKVAILDLDPQGSASLWRRMRKLDTPVVVAVPDVSIERAVAGAKADGFDFVIIDSPPSVSPASSRIVAVADLVVIPVKPGPFDIGALPAALKLIGNKRAVFVLSDCPQRAPEIAEARIYLAQFKNPVIGQINNRRAFFRALTNGQAVSEFESDGLPASEIQEVFEAILKELKK